jgi:hypothetical protein
MYNYKIAEINVCVLWENEARKNNNYQYHDCIILPRSLAAFYNEAITEIPDMKVLVRELRECTGVDYHKRIYNQAFYISADKIVMTVFDPSYLEKPGFSIEMSKDYSQVEYIPHIREYEHYDLQWMMYPFEGRFLYTGGVVLHGAAVEYNGKGFIFTGISGAGKTTQAHLWQKHRNALIINGDCPSIRIKDDIPYLYGTPWCGTSGESINRKTHLSAVILVKKGDTNTIRELKGTSAFLAILANVLHSCFDKATLDLSISNIEYMIKHIRVFELTCTISEDAVKILEKEIMYKQ